MKEYNKKKITSKIKENDSRERKRTFRRFLLLKMS